MSMYLAPWYVSKIDFRMRMVFGAFISIVSFNYPAENTMIACNRRNAMRRAETVKQMREAAAAAKAASQGN